MTDGPHYRRLADWMFRHPIATVMSVAFTVRAVVALVLNVTNTWSLAPDAHQYLALAEAVSAGRLDSFWPGYGPSLYNSTRVFSGQVVFLFDLFGPYRISAQLVAVFYGSLTAGLTVLLARRFIRPAFALAAGLVVALVPSQILWSTVALRESTIWALLAGIAVILGNLSPTSTRRSIFVAVLSVAMAYLCLESLRGQTAFLALWSGTLALLVGRGDRRARVVAAAALLLVAPLAANHQPGAVDLLYTASKRLGTVRTYMAMGAESTIYDSTSRSDDGMLPGADIDGSVDPEGSDSVVPGGDEIDLLERESTVVLPGADIDGSVDPEGSNSVVPGGNEIDLLERESTVVDGQKFVVDADGNAFPVYNDLEANLQAFPSGLMAAAVRPFPWDSRQTGKHLASSIESVFWASVFILAAVGTWFRRRELGVVAFPVVFSVVYLVSAALTQGNLGTAFRHRAQILFAIVLLAFAGVQVLWDRRKSRNLWPS